MGALYCAPELGPAEVLHPVSFTRSLPNRDRVCTAQDAAVKAHGSALLILTFTEAFRFLPLELVTFY